MPIKLPKGILGRRASGNALEELQNPPEPSFRVIERPQNSRSFEGGESFKRISYGRPLSADRFTEDHLLTSSSPNPNNRGSGGTNNSRSSGGNDNSSVSARFSSTSTLPSSTDIPLDDRHSPNPTDRFDSRFDMPAAPPVPEATSNYSLRAAGRALSFGRKKPDSSQTTPRPAMEHASAEGPTHYTRDRALTESSYASGSTATPPKLFDAGLDIGRSDDGFGSMFENFGTRKSQITPPDQGTLEFLRTQSPERIVSGGPSSSDRSTSGMTPAPLKVDRHREIDPSPSSWASQHAQDDFAHSTSPMERTFSYEDDMAVKRAGNWPTKSRTMPLNGPPDPLLKSTQQRTPSKGLATSNVYGPRRASPEDRLDADARLVMESISASRKLERYSSGNYSDEDENPAAPLVSPSAHDDSFRAAQGPSRMPENRQRSPGLVFDSSDRDFTSHRQRQGSAETTPRAQKSHLAYQNDSSLFDAPTHSGRQAPVVRPKIPPPARPQTQNKIMTPAQFEQYRKQQEMTSTAHPREKEDSDDEEDDYDDDEVERSKQAARERRKQEAHMSVYRQQMMKVTGEQPSDLPNIQLRPTVDRSSASAPNLGSSSIIPEFSFDKPSESGTASDDDEDEDVPLGVLAAHGFPSKNKPPSAMSNAGSRIQFKSESYPPPTSVSGAPGSRASALPAFARNLPPDPYFGAGLVNPSNREPLALGQGAPRSVHGGSQLGSASPVPGPPGGLVGVINAEERARAARRGSPNAGGMPLPPSMGGMPPMISPGEQATQQATAHMSEQMNQMMQMQMQWMSQMQAMMAGGAMMMPPTGQHPSFTPPMPQMMPPGMAPPPAPGHLQQRPLSQGSHSAPITPMGQPPQQRAMSMMGPGPGAPWPPNMPNRKSTAPSMMTGALDSVSIAPSERSNIGQPSRYRPVSIAPTDEKRNGSRTSTFTDGNLQPGISARSSRLSNSGNQSQGRFSGLRAVSTSPQPNKKGADDDDDEEGWAAMKQKTDKKKNMWRLNRKSRAPTSAGEGYEVYDYPAE